HADIAVSRRQQTHGDVHAGRLAGAVAAEKAEQLRLAASEGHAVQHVAVAVEGVDGFQAERVSGQGKPPGYADRPPPRRGCPRSSPWSHRAGFASAIDARLAARRSTDRRRARQAEVPWAFAPAPWRSRRGD